MASSPPPASASASVAAAEPSSATSDSTTIPISPETNASVDSHAHPTFNDGTITAVEKTRLAELRVALADCRDVAGLLYSLDTRLVKYLRARKGDVKRAAEFFKMALEYRMKNGLMIDTLLTEFKPPKEIFTHVCKFPVPFFHDKHGGLVMYNRAGLMYGWKICTTLGVDKVCKTFAWFLEHMTRRATANIAKYPKVAPRFTMIFDLTGFGSHCFGPLNCTAALVKLFQNLYPSSLRRCILVNTPWVFRLAWRLVTPFLDVVVKNKIMVLAGPSCDTIFKFVDPEQVPAFMGGKMIEDGDEYCGKSILSNGDPYAE